MAAERAVWAPRRGVEPAASTIDLTASAVGQVEASPRRRTSTRTDLSAADRLARTLSASVPADLDVLAAGNSDARSLRSVASAASLRVPGSDEPTTGMIRRSPTKRQRIETSSSAPINEDPSASLILANGDGGGDGDGPARDASAERTVAPEVEVPAHVVRRRPSWFDFGRSYGAPVPAIEPAAAGPVVAQVAAPIEAEATTAPTDVAPALQPPAPVADGSDLTRSTSSWLAYLPLTSYGRPSSVASAPPAPVTAAPAVEPVASPPIDMPAQPAKAATRKPAGSPGSARAVMLSSSRGSVVDAAPRRGRAEGTAAGSLLTPDRAATSSSRDGSRARSPAPASSAALANIVADGPALPAPVAQADASSSSMPRSTSSASWWSWGQPATPTHPQTETAAATTVSAPTSPALVATQPPTALEPPISTLSQSQQRSSWFGSLYGTVPPSSLAPPSAPTSQPSESARTSMDDPTGNVALGSSVSSASASNSVISTLPSSEASWARWFGSRRVARPSPLVPQEPDAESEPPREKPAVPPLTSSKPVKKAATSTSSAPGTPSQPGTPTTARPNLVLPSFEDTFGRPPRSIRPRDRPPVIRRAFSLASRLLVPPNATVDPREESAERLPKTHTVLGQPVPLDQTRKCVVLGAHGWYFFTPAPRRTDGHERTPRLDARHVRPHLFRVARPRPGRRRPDRNPARGRRSGRAARRAAAQAADGPSRLARRPALGRRRLCRRPLAGLSGRDGPVGPTHRRRRSRSAQGRPALHGFGRVRPVPLPRSIFDSRALLCLQGEAARELFQFQNPGSTASLWYRKAITTVLEAGVKILAIASLDDQVVPAYSGIQHAIDHPGMLRAVFIDSAAFSSTSFIANLVTFALHLRNAGLDDQNLVVLLSDALAGSLTGVGHSKIYDEQAVYDLAVRYALETAPPPSGGLTIGKSSSPCRFLDDFDPRVRPTNYALPWALRGLLEDRRVRELFDDELVELRETFEDWQPLTKPLRDIKRALEPLRLIPRKPAPAPSESTRKVAKL